MTDVNTSDSSFLQPCFLGPAGEKDRLLESPVVESLHDHVCWRRNFHPEDGFRIIPDALGLDRATFRMLPRDLERDADHRHILRHTLMNPRLLAGPADRNDVDLYWAFSWRQS